MLTALFIAALSIIPRDDVVRDRCDLIEVNWFYDEQGRLVFTQAIFYDWSYPDARYNVRAWRLVKHPSQLPERDWNGKGYSAMWDDAGVMRRVWSQSIRETWLQYDPELAEREVLPVEKRRALRTK